MFEHLAPVIERRLEIRGREGPGKPVKGLPVNDENLLISFAGRLHAISYRYVTSKDAMERATDDWRNHGYLAATFALEDLCLHPECIEPLRQELEESTDGAAVLDLGAFPLLDSFLKESSRLSVSDASE
ncbi:MAG: hypothetical protein Q9178_001416 [Gyalolechia marmorata]